MSEVGKDFLFVIQKKQSCKGTGEEIQELLALWALLIWSLSIFTPPGRPEKIASHSAMREHYTAGEKGLLGNPQYTRLKGAISFGKGCYWSTGFNLCPHNYVNSITGTCSCYYTNTESELCFRREKSASDQSDMPQVKPVIVSSHFLLPGLTSFLSSTPFGVGTWSFPLSEGNC